MNRVVFVIVLVQKILETIFSAIYQIANFIHTAILGECKSWFSVLSVSLNLLESSFSHQGRYIL